MQQGEDIIQENGPKAKELELVFEDNQYQLTGVAISKNGRLFTCYPRWECSHQYSLIEIFQGNMTRPYPNEAMNSWKDGEPGREKWVFVQSVFIDDEDALWVVDAACPQMEQVYQNSHKLVKINLTTNAVERVYYFEGVAGDKSYINDVRVDTRRGFAFLTNANEGGILVVNLQTGSIRQLLQDHPSVLSDPDFCFVIEGRELMKEGRPAKVHSDGIALTPDGEWLYYKPLTDNKLYRIRAKIIIDETLAPVEVTEWVEDMGTFTTSDGIIFDHAANLYIGDLQASAIMMVDKDHKLSLVLQDERLIWPDSFAVSNDGYLYISVSQIHKQPAYNNGEDKRTGLYSIYRIKL